MSSEPVNSGGENVPAAEVAAPMESSDNNGGAAPTSAAPASDSKSSLDVALGDIIDAKRKQRGGRGKGRQGGRKDGGSSAHPLDRTRDGGSGPIRRDRGSRGGNRDRDAPYSRSGGRGGFDLAAAAPFYPPMPMPMPPPAKIVGDTVRLSNLDPGVNEDDLRYIFSKIGTIRRLAVHYDSSGRSLGTGEITFASQSAAETAVRDLDQAEVDGRIMYVTLVGQVQPVVTPPITVPLAYAPTVVQRGGGGRRDDRDRDRDRDRGGRRGGDRDRDRDRGRDDRRGGGGRGGGRRRGGGGGGGGGRKERPAASATDLDAEMDSYMASKSTSSNAASGSTDAPAASSNNAEAPMEAGP